MRKPLRYPYPTQTRLGVVREGRNRYVRRRFLIAAWVFFGFAGVGLGYGSILIRGARDVTSLGTHAPVETGYMRYHMEQRAGSREREWTWVDLDEISPLLVCSIVKSEDRMFFRHNGFDWPQLRKAIRNQLFRQGPRMGGSTISQQLARNLFLTPERTVGRKLREAVITRRLESALPKVRILELYVNVIEFGDGVWGVEAASRHYFHKPTTDLTPFEATFLASVIAAPKQPMVGWNRQRSERIVRRVLRQLYGSGLLTEVELREAWRTADLFYKKAVQDSTASVPFDYSGPAAEATHIDRQQRTTGIEASTLDSDECGLQWELLRRRQTSLGR